MVFAEQTGHAVETVDLILRSAIETLRALRGNPPVGGPAYDAPLAARIRGVQQVLELGSRDCAKSVVVADRKAPPRTV
jgi:hypothetical protein